LALKPAGVFKEKKSMEVRWKMNLGFQLFTLIVVTGMLTWLCTTRKALPAVAVVSAAS
jgi:hypothetical protein